MYIVSGTDRFIVRGLCYDSPLDLPNCQIIGSDEQEIGQQPVLSFGNSTGDASMAEYVTSNNRFKSLAFMLCCDDTERENGSEKKAQKMYDLCAEFVWVPISMKNDWTTIYGDNVTYTKKKTS